MDSRQHITSGKGMTNEAALSAEIILANFLAFSGKLPMLVQTEATTEVTATAISGLATRAYLDMRFKEADARIDKMKAELGEQLSQWGLRMITYFSIWG